MTHTTHAFQHASIWQRLAGLRADLAERAAQRRAFRSTMAELDGLSDRDLADMGIHRSQIAAIAEQAAQGA